MMTYTLIPHGKVQCNQRAVDDLLARVLKIHGDPIADDRLHLADAPVGLAWVRDQLAWL